MTKKKGLKWTVAKNFAYECITLGRPIETSKEIIKGYWRTAEYLLQDDKGFSAIKVVSPTYKNTWNLSLEPTKMPSWINKVAMQPEDNIGDLKISATIKNNHTIDLMLQPDSTTKGLYDRTFKFHGAAYHGPMIDLSYYV